MTQRKFNIDKEKTRMYVSKILEIWEVNYFKRVYIYANFLFFQDGRLWCSDNSMLRFYDAEAIFGGEGEKQEY